MVGYETYRSLEISKNAIAHPDYRSVVVLNALITATSARKDH